MPKSFTKLTPGKLYRTIGNITFNKIGITRNIIVMLLTIEEDIDWGSKHGHKVFIVKLLIDGKIIVRNNAFAHWFQELE